MDSEQVNKGIEEAVAAVKKASEENWKIKEGLKEKNNVIYVTIGNHVQVPVKIDAVEPKEPLDGENLPIDTFSS